AGADLVTVVQRQARQLAPRYADVGDPAGADLASGGGQLLAEQLADRVAVAAQRRRSDAPGRDRARDRDRGRRGMAQRKARELTPQRRMRVALGVGPPGGGRLGGGLGQPGELALLEESDPGERMLAADHRVEGPRNLAGALPSRQPVGAGR